MKIVAIRRKNLEVIYGRRIS